MINLMIVMFIGGLWHGAAWTFVVWGLLHGSYLAIERLSKAIVRRAALDATLSRCKLLLGLDHLLRGLRRVGFLPRIRISTIASRMISGMFGGHAQAGCDPQHARDFAGGVVTIGLLIAHWTLRETSIEAAVARLPRWVVRQCLVSHGRRDHSHPRQQQCIHLLPILSGVIPDAAVARNHRDRDRGRVHRSHGAGKFIAVR